MPKPPNRSIIIFQLKQVTFLVLLMNTFAHLMAGLVNPPAAFARHLANQVNSGGAGAGIAVVFASPKAGLVIAKTTFAKVVKAFASTKATEAEAKAAFAVTKTGFARVFAGFAEVFADWVKAKAAFALAKAGETGAKALKIVILAAKG
jgi:hypothetical protein